MTSSSDVAGSCRSLRFIRPYVPFAAMTAAYLWLRYLLFGQVAREGALNARALEDFGVLLGRHTRHVVAGDMNAPAIVVWLALTAVVAVWLATRARARLQMASAPVGWGRRLLYFGPVWWAIGVLPIAVAGYHSPRHVYLAAVGWAIVLGLAFEAAWLARASVTWRRTVAASAALVLLGYIVPLYRSVVDWREMADVSHTVVRDVRDAALSAPPGSLIVVGAPGRSWEWALPFAVRPPYQRTDLRDRVFIISPRALSCCTGAMVRRNPPGDSRLGVWRQPGFRRRVAVGSAHGSIVSSDRCGYTAARRFDPRARRYARGGPRQ